MKTISTPSGILGWHTVVSLYPWSKHSIHSLLTTTFPIIKETIPRGFRQQYIPSWNDECNHHYKEFVQAENKQSANLKAAVLMNHLNKKRNKRMEETVKGIDFTYSSRKACKTFNRLIGRKFDSKQCPITANSIAKQLLASGRFRGFDKQRDLSVKRRCSKMWEVPGVGAPWPHLTPPQNSQRP